MAEILTQNEIDELWQSLNAGEDVPENDDLTDAKNVKVFDFRSANRIPREQIRTLALIYEQYARLLATYLTGSMGVFCEAQKVAVEEQKFFEFTNSVMPGSLFVLLKMKPLSGTILMCISPEIAYAIVENLLGGAGTHTQNRRAFTEIDLVILEKIIRNMLPMNNEAWDKIIKVETLHESTETSLQFAQIVPPDEAIAIVTLQMKLGGVESFLNICLPHAALDPFAKTINVQKIAVGHREVVKQQSSFSKEILTHIKNSSIPIKGVFSATDLTVQEISHLQVGDVIRLDHPIDRPICLNIGHIPRLQGILGTKQKRYSIKVTNIVFEEGEENE